MQSDDKAGARDVPARMTQAEFADWRREMDLSYNAAAQLLEVTRRTVFHYERGNPHRPSSTSLPPAASQKCRDWLAAKRAGRAIPGAGTYERDGYPPGRPRKRRDPKD